MKDDLIAPALEEFAKAAESARTRYGLLGMQPMFKAADERARQSAEYELARAEYWRAMDALRECARETVTRPPP